MVILPNLLLIFLGSLFLMVLWVLIAEIKIFQIFKNDASPYLKIRYNNIEVGYLWRLNGGGVLFAHEFVRLVSQKLGKVNHAFEYCAGPGFIGFALLANNLCDRLTLAELNPNAVEAIKETIKKNNLQDRVTVYQSDCLDSIPRTEQWDLVVGNPPWDISHKEKSDIRVHDPQGRVHKKFFQDIHKFLKPDGTVLFVEGGEYTCARDFKEMAAAGGLEPIKCTSPWARRQYKGVSLATVIFLKVSLAFREVYFIWCKRKQPVTGEE